MGEKAKITLNNVLALQLFKNENLDLSKFYTPDLKLMIRAGSQELNRLIGENKALKVQLDKISVFVRTHIYSITTYPEESKINKLSLEDEQLEEFLMLLEELK